MQHPLISHRDEGTTFRVAQVRRNLPRPPFQPLNLFTHSSQPRWRGKRGVDRHCPGVPGFLFTFCRFVALPIEIIAGKLSHCPPATLSLGPRTSRPFSHPEPPFRALAIPSPPPPFRPLSRRRCSLQPSPPPVRHSPTSARFIHLLFRVVPLTRSRSPSCASLSASALSKRGWLRPILRIRTENRSRSGVGARGSGRMQAPGCFFSRTLALLSLLPLPSTLATSFSSPFFYLGALASRVMRARPITLPRTTRQVFSPLVCTRCRID